MTAPTPEGALAEEAARGVEHMVRVRAEAFRAGAEAMREAAAVAAADSWGHTPKPSKQDKYQMGYAAGHAEGCRLSAARIRSLDVPEEPR